MAFDFILPVINVTTDPTWSQEFLDIFNSISTHTHTGLSGDAAQINAANLLLTADFSLGGYNTINARSYIMQNLSADPDGVNDVCSLYSKNGNFYFNNQLGTHVQITNGNTINTVSTVASAWSYLAVTTNFTLQIADGYTYLAVNTSGARSIFLPAASTVPTGRFFIVKDATGQSETNAITFVPNGADAIDTVAANYIVKKKYGSWMLVSNGTNGWLISNYSNKELNDGTIRANGNNINLIAAAENITATGAAISSTSTAATSITAGTSLTLLSTAATSVTASALSLLSTTDVTINSNVDVLITSQENIVLNSVGSMTAFANITMALSAQQINMDAIDGIHIANILYVNEIRPWSGTLITLGNIGSSVIVTNHFEVTGVSVLHATGVNGNLTCTGAIELDDLLNAHGNVSLGDDGTNTVDINGITTFNANATVDANLIVNGDTSLGTTSSNQLTVEASVDFNSPVLLNDDVDIGSSTSDTISIRGKINTAIQYALGGRPTEPVIVLPNSNSSIDIDTYVNAVIPNTVTGSKTYTVSGSPLNGSYLYIFNEDSGSHDITGLFSFTIASGEAYKAMYNGSTWQFHLWFL